MAHFAFRVDALPLDVFPALTSFLTGYDLVRLSHVNQQLFEGLLVRDNIVWQQRLPPIDPVRMGSSWKEIYCKSNSRCFPGSAIVDTESRPQVRGGAVEVLDFAMDRWSSESFSIDVWFAMQPSRPGTTGTTTKSYVGGILLGAQCEDRLDEWWPDEHAQFIHVDTEGNLFCSFTDDKPVIATKLQLQRWYHVTLTYTHDGNQCVYLDGQLVHSGQGALHEQWDELHYLQLGTGCITGDEPGKPAPDFTGWYGFNGVIDHCRFWTGALTQQQVKRLALGYGETLDETITQCLWSLKTSPPDPFGSVTSVRCSRQRERVCLLDANPL